MATAALLRVDDTGLVIAANDVAERWLGPCVGRPCHALIGAVTPAGAAHCTARCAARLGHAGRSLDATVVRARVGALTCAALGDEVIVALHPHADAPVATPLSDREREVLGLVAQGFTNRRVARRLDLSMSTVRTHMERILDKLDVRSRASAVSRAIATGQLPNP